MKPHSPPPPRGVDELPVLEHFPDAWLIVDLAGSILGCGGMTVQALGEPIDQLAGRPLTGLLHPDDAPGLIDFLAGLQRNPGPSFGLRFRRREPGNSWRWVAASGRCLDAQVATAILACRDISERVLAEESLHQFRAMVEQMADPALITSVHGVISYVNPAFESLTGYTQAETLGYRPSILKSGQHPPEFYAKLWQTILGGRVYRGVIVNRKKNGDLYYEDKVIAPLKDMQGRITHFVSTGRDITSRIQAEISLLESENRFRITSELTSDYIYSAAVGPGGQLLMEWATNAFTEMTGFTPALVRERGGWSSLVHPEDGAYFQARRKRLLEGQPDVSEYRLVTRDGQVRWVRDYARPEVDAASGRVTRILGATQDITERKQAEVALAQLAAIVESSDDAIYGLALDGEIVNWNAAAEFLYGYTAAEVVGRPVGLLFPPDRRLELAHEMELLRKGERIPYHLAVRLRRDGRRIEVWVSSFPIREAAGHVTGSASVARLVSD